MSVAPHRLRALDGLRGVAAIAVVLYHFLFIIPGEDPSIGSVVAVAKYGAQGVQLFFVISGFVIMMSLRRGSLRSFVSARVARLFPAYWAAIAVTTFVVTLVPITGTKVSIGQVAINATMLQSYFGVAHVDGAYWTLAIELAFYVQAAALWFGGLLRGNRLLPTLWIWLGVTVSLSLLVHGGPQEPSTPLWARDVLQAFVYAPWFICGILALSIYEGRRGWPIWLLVAAAGAAMVCLDAQKNIGLLGVLYLGVILVAVLWRPLGLTFRPLLFLGDISYALYLMHQEIGRVVLVYLHDVGVPRWIAVGCAIVIVIAIAWGVTRWIDIPLRGRVRHLLLGHGSASPVPMTEVNSKS